MPAMQLHWDIFCRVVDNYGDIGVCWRLARQLAAEHGKRVRLWVDEPAALAPLCPDCDPARDEQSLAGIELRRWPAADAAVDWAAAAKTADVVIEAFACELPAAYLQGLARRERRPVWLNLEYLSAEAWVDGCHGMASPHPSLPLTKHFVFPGFTPSTAGLLREADACPALPALAAETLEISLFCYDDAPVGALFAALADLAQPVRCLVPPGKPLAATQAALGAGSAWQLGRLQVDAIPFLSQTAYDALLRRCALNFVRGEDSFVRAQWAGRPFVWQIYRQDDDAHLVKLDAFLARYLNGLPPATAATLRALFLAWNGVGDPAPAIAATLRRLPEFAVHAVDWRNSLKKQRDLASSLIQFCADKV